MLCYMPLQLHRWHLSLQVDFAHVAHEFIEHSEYKKFVFGDAINVQI